MLACVPSFTPRLIAMCECSSIMPGVRCLPVPSITMALGSALSKMFPMCFIFPSLMSTSVINVPCVSKVQTVAPLIKIVPALGIESKPYAMLGKVTLPTIKESLAAGLSSFFFSSFFLRMAVQVVQLPSGKVPRPSHEPLSKLITPAKLYKPSPI